MSGPRGPPTDEEIDDFIMSNSLLDEETQEADRPIPACSASTPRPPALPRLGCENSAATFLIGLRTAVGLVLIYRGELCCHARTN